MKKATLCIGTHAYLLKTTLQQNDGEPLVHETTAFDQGHFGGLDFAPDGTLFVSRRRLYNPIKDGYQHFAGDSTICRYKDLKRHEIIGGLQSVHHLRYGHGGWFIVETGRNHLLWFKGDAFTNYHEWIFDATAVDKNHPNCIEILDDQHVAVMLHNRGDEPSQIALLEHTPSGFEPLNRFPLPHEEAHDFYFEGQHIVYLASEAGHLVVYDYANERVVESVDLGGFCKGLARLGNMLVVGTSPKAERPHRTRTKGEIAIVSLSTMEVEAVFSPTDDHPCGNINDVRLQP